MLNILIEHLSHVVPIAFAARDSGFVGGTNAYFDPALIAQYLEARTEARLANLRKRQ